MSELTRAVNVTVSELLEPNVLLSFTTSVVAVTVVPVTVDGVVAPIVVPLTEPPVIATLLAF